jgi:hypothetical protein
MSSDDKNPPMPLLHNTNHSHNTNNSTINDQVLNNSSSNTTTSVTNDHLPQNPDILNDNMQIDDEGISTSTSVLSQNTSNVVSNSVSDNSQSSTITTYSKIPSNGIVLSRDKNKGFDDLLKYDLNIDQCSYYRDTINSNLAKEYHNLKLESDRVNYMNALIRDKFQSKRVFKYHENLDEFTELSRKSVFIIVREKLINIKANQKCVNKQSSKRSHSSSDKLSKQPKSTNIVQSKPFSLKAYEKSHPYSTFYPKRNELYDMHNWHYYSMFHSLYQSFSIVVYNYSHRLGDNETIHRSTRLKINFPTNANALLIIHGRLVHSGSASKSENILSYNHSHDLRLFAEIFKEQSTTSSNRNTSSTSARRSTRTEVASVYKNHTPFGEVDRKTFVMCNSNCNCCVNMTGTKVLNIEDIYNDNNWRIGLTTRDKAPKKVIGDLIKFGWVIYTGVNVHHKEYVSELDVEFNELVKNKPKRMWHGIGGTERRIFKLDEFMIEDPNKKLIETKTISKVFDDIQSRVVNKIIPFKNGAILKKRSLLANFGEVVEQQPHRDYGSSKCKDPNSSITYNI